MECHNNNAIKINQLHVRYGNVTYHKIKLFAMRELHICIVKQIVAMHQLNNAIFFVVIKSMLCYSITLALNPFQCHTITVVKVSCTVISSPLVSGLFSVEYQNDSNIQILQYVGKIRKISYIFKDMGTVCSFITN